MHRQQYWVEMESQAKCAGTDSVYVKLITDETPSDYLYIPNAFTPNNDGLNDTFKVISGSSISHFAMLIFDRWGGKIFESDDISQGWDGTKNGHPCPGDVYYYKIVFRINDAIVDFADQARYGTVMVVR